MHGMLAGKDAGNDETAVADTEGAQSNVTPEEQRAYEAFVDNGLKLISDEKASTSLLQRIEADDDKVGALADATLAVLGRLEASAGQKGHQIGPDILLHGGVEILESIAEIARVARVYDYSEDEMEAATYRAIDSYRQAKQQSGEFDQRAAQEDMAIFQEAEKNGALESQFPGLKEAFGGDKTAPADDEEAEEDD